MNNSLKFFYCYSSHLYKYLKSRGIKYINMGRNENSGSVYSLYLRDDRFNNILTEYGLSRIK